MPQAIGHRGYNAVFPENTMAAFRGAVEVGAHALETDLHLSKDGTIVLSHVREFEFHRIILFKTSRLIIPIFHRMPR